MDSDNRIVALHCYSPFDIYSSEKHFRGCFDEEWISISETRGLGRLLAKKLLNKVDVYCGYGCNELSKAAFKKLGVTFVATTPRVVSILDRRAIIKMISEAEGELPLFDVPNDTLSHNVSFKILSFDEVSEHSIENNLTKDDLAVHKDIQWLNWRYNNHPYIKYIYIGCFNLPSSSFAVVRVESYRDLLFIRIVDLFGSVGTFSKLYEAVLAYSCSINAVMVDYFNTSPVPINFIANAVQGAYKNLRFPFKFQPLDLRGGPSYNFVFSSKIQNIFVSSKGDSTQDIYRNGFQSPILHHQ